MKYIKRFEGKYLTLPPEETIILFINTTAIIDDELAVFETAMEKFLKKEEGKKYVGKNLEVFVRVSADFSSGNGLFYVEGGDYRECTKEEWKAISTKFKKEGINRVDDLKNTKAFKVYHISI